MYILRWQNLLSVSNEGFTLFLIITTIQHQKYSWSLRIERCHFFLRLFIVGMKDASYFIQTGLAEFPGLCIWAWNRIFPHRKKQQHPRHLEVPQRLHQYNRNMCRGNSALFDAGSSNNLDDMTFLSIATLLTVHLYYFSLLLGEHPKLSEVWFLKKLYTIVF